MVSRISKERSDVWFSRSFFLIRLKVVSIVHLLQQNLVYRQSKIVVRGINSSSFETVASKIFLTWFASKLVSFWKKKKNIGGKMEKMYWACCIGLAIDRSRGSILDSQVNPMALFSVFSSVICYLLFYVQDGTGEVRESTPYPLETWSEALETQGKKSRKLTAVSCFAVCWYFLWPVFWSVLPSSHPNG